MRLEKACAIKQFIIRLYRNKLFVDTIMKCFVCNKHNESRTELLLNCSMTNKLPQFLIRILRKVDGLMNNCRVDMFLFKDYPINSIENSSSMFTWKYVYNCKYNKCSPVMKSFAYAYRGLIAIITYMSLPQLLMARNVLEILNLDLDK